MGPSTDQIQTELTETREDLDRKLDDIERRAEFSLRKYAKYAPAAAGALGTTGAVIGAVLLGSISPALSIASQPAGAATTTIVSLTFDDGIDRAFAGQFRKDVNVGDIRLRREPVRPAGNLAQLGDGLLTQLRLLLQ